VKTLLNLLFFMLLSSFHVNANDLYQVTLDEKDFLLLSVQLDKDTVSSSVDAYQYKQQVMVAIEPLFNSLNLRYQLRLDSLMVWKNERAVEYRLISTEAGSPSLDVWGSDGYFQYISQQTLAELFDITIELDRQKLSLKISTSEYQFPVTIIHQQQQQRFKNQAYQYQKSTAAKVQVPITIADQYRLATLPHGEIFHSLDLSDSEDRNRTSVQLISDLFYHSARINLNKSQGNDLTGGINFTRYKTSPNDRILGAFDQYSFGDVSGYSGGSITGSQSGVGFTIQRNKQNYRQSNTQINIEEYAPPGWEAEIFLNNRLVTATTVPDTGLLVFNDMDIYYGRNDFLIKVYGPFGEIEEYQQSYPLTANPLTGGDTAYSAFLLDNQRTLLNGNANNDFSLNSIGGAFDYGISDRWQLGLAVQNYTNQADEQLQLLGVNNYVNLPGLLLENKLVINANSNYEQRTTLSGSLFDEGVYSLQYESSNGFNTDANTTLNSDAYEQFRLNYSNWFWDLPFRVSASYSDSGDVAVQTLSHNTNFNYRRLRFTHSLNYTRVDQNFAGEKFSTDNLTGSLGVSGSLSKNLRLSANLPYDPQQSDFISDSARLTAQYKWQDPYFLTHYFTLNYRPIADTNNEWQLSHRLAFETQDYRLSLRSAYKADESWSFALNFNFFFGYDYYNQRALTSSKISQQSATLDVHAYLDRQLNGVPDVLDYELEGVEFYGNQNWQGLTTGKSGKILLPGAMTNTPFRFGATWKEGSETINNDYVVYTHPGARVSVNMPFYLSTELVGFVYRQAANGEVPVSQIRVDLLEESGEVVQTQLTDIDGYFEFNNMKPNQYTVAINTEHLHQKALTAEVRGFEINTPSIGGFTELPPFYVRQQSSENDLDKEIITPLTLTKKDIEVLVWDKDEEKRKNYFSLPTKQKIMAAHSLDAPQIKKAKPAEQTAPVLNAALVQGQQPQAIGNNAPVVQQTAIDGNLAVKTTPEVNANLDQLSPYYSLQLGAFMDEDNAAQMASQFAARLAGPFSIVKSQQDNWQSIYKLYLGKFTHKEQAQVFVINNQLADSEYMLKQVSQADANLLEWGTGSENGVQSPQNWVIQFHASKTPILQSDGELLSTKLSLYRAKKLLPNSDAVWHCLISQGFATKQQAIAALQASQLNGWVSAISAYTKIEKLSTEGVN
jgi:cell division septation protein DedD